MELVGKTLGKYRIVEKIGSGGMADVYKGLQIGLEREVAIKVLPPVYAKDLDRLKRFRRESQATAKLSHPNIITIYDSGEQEGYYYYVMEYLRAESLELIIKRDGKLPLKQAIKIAKDILKALIYCHGKEIVHRDLKPGNIKFDLRGNAIVTDFGLVKDLQETSITMTGISIGTPEYMSPEQLLGEDVDPKSDIYQLGVILYEMLTGRTPFAGKNPYAGGASAQPPAITPPSQLNQEVPDTFDEIALKALERDKTKRYAAADEFSQAITKFERKLEARQMSARPSTAASAATASFKTKSVALSEAGVANPTVATSSDQIPGGQPGSGTLKYMLSLIAGPGYEEQSPKELAYNVSMVVVPVLVTLGLLVAYLTGHLFPKPALKLLEHAIEAESKRSTISWKANAPCLSFIQYYTSLDSRQETPRPPEPRTEFREAVEKLEPDTTYYFQFVFTYDADDPDSFVYSKELEFKTKPEIKIRNISFDPSDTEVRVTWTTNLETDTKVRIGKSTDYSREQENPEQLRETDHSITISGLDADTEYHFVIVATDPDQQGESTFSEDKTFRSRLAGQSKSMIGPDGSGEPPLVELAKSYVDKLTRMTPDERRKLKDSLQNYLIIDAEKILTKEKKRDILKEPSTEDTFNDRLRFFKVWTEQLQKLKIEHGFAANEDAVVQNLYFVNPKKSFKRLDESLKKLSTLDPETKG